jgi:hypothetical protein
MELTTDNHLLGARKLKFLKHRFNGAGQDGLSMCDID